MVITYEFSVRPGTARQAAQMVERELVESRTWQGCVDVQIFTETGADTVFLYERWESPEHAARYREWRAGAGKTNPLLEFVTAPPIRRTFEEL